MAVDQPNGTSTRPPFTVALVGGGIVGLILASGLHRVGINVKVYEQARTFREIGAGIAFTANAIRCMGLISPTIPEALRSGGSVATSNGDENDVSQDRNDYLRWIDGYERNGPDHDLQELFFKIDAGYRGFEGCRRDQFLEALVKTLPESIIELGRKLVDVDDRVDGKVLLKFHDGDTAEVDAVIGCDGIKSTVRRIMLGSEHPAAAPRYTHCVAYRTLIPMDKAVEALGKYKAMNQHNHVGPGAHLLHYPVANNAMLNVAAFVHDSEDWPEDRPTVVDSSRLEAKAAFKGWCAPICRLVDNFSETLSKWAIFDLYEHPLPFYNSGRTCLAGDAAHASSPHHGAGAGQGVEDALCLTVLMQRVLEDTADGSQDLQAALRVAFSTFDAVRRTRSQWLVNSSRRVCDLYEQPEWADDAKLDRAKTCFEEIKDRSLKIWHFDHEKMLQETLEIYKHMLAVSNGSEKPIKQRSFY